MHPFGALILMKDSNQLSHEGFTCMKIFIMMLLPFLVLSCQANLLNFLIMGEVKCWHARSVHGVWFLT